MAGKGDKPRPVNKLKYNENYDLINWKNKKKTYKNTIEKK
jgi:hypothetical protein